MRLRVSASMSISQPEPPVMSRAHEGVELVADGWAGAGKELLADFEDRRQQIFRGFA
jgi:hypothetical protein